MSIHFILIMIIIIKYQINKINTKNFKNNNNANNIININIINTTPYEILIGNEISDVNNLINKSIKKNIYKS